MKKNASGLSLTSILMVAVVIVLLVSTQIGALAEITDGTVARDKLHREVRTLMHDQNYQALEKMAKDFRAGKARFPDGGWKLTFFYNAFSDPYYGWEELFRNLDAWSKKYPESITRRVASAVAWIKFGFKARGSGYANTVTEEGWKLMHERVAKAYEMVKDSPKDRSGDCAHRYRTLLTIARVQGWERQRYEQLFQKAISFEPSHTGYYIEKSDYLLPRWHGEKGEWQNFADEAVRLAPASEGMAMYTHILRNVWLANEFKEFREPDISWKKMKQGFLDIERQYPNSPYNLNLYCYFACLAKDKKTAKELFKRIGDEPYPGLWGGKSDFLKWQSWAYSD